jgi:hypothetical protein
MGGYQAKVIVALGMVDISSARFKQLIEGGFTYSLRQGILPIGASIDEQNKANKLSNWLEVEKEKRDAEILRETGQQYGKLSDKSKQRGVERLRKFTENWKVENKCDQPCSHLDLWKGIDKHPKAGF